MIDGTAAARTLLGFNNLTPGMCLYYVWLAYKAQGAVANGTYPTALAGWNGSPGKRAGDRNPPPGVPVWFGARPGSDAGDVVISLGGGRVACTDYPTWGRTGSCTIDERQRQIGRPYLGWTETILGAAIALPTSASTNPEPKEEDMPTPKEIVNELLNYPAFDAGPSVSEMFKRTNEVYNAMFHGGPSMEDGERSASFSLKNVTEFVDRIDRRVLGVHQAVFDGGTSMPDGGLSLGQSLADAREALAGIGERLDAIEGALREPKAS